MKNLSKLTTILLMLLLCVGVYSCSDDKDDDPETESKKSSIVGSWKATFGDDYEIYTFNANGTGKFTVYEEGEIYTETFAYAYDETIKLLTLRWWDDTDYEEYVEYVEAYVTGNTLVWTEGGDTDYYKKM